MKIHFNPEGSAIRPGENQGFTCEHCGTVVVPVTNGSYRNHCPTCLWSKHVDVVPGDRSASCGGPMVPVGLDTRPGKGWVVVHRCRRCGTTRPNRLAVDTAQPDDLDEVIRLSTSTWLR